MSANQPTKEFLKSAVYLVDSSSYIFRAYYAIRAGLTAPDGTPTHATYGFVQMVLSLLDIYQPHHCVFIWDTKEKGFRHNIFPEYKANRSAPPEDLGIQIDNSKKFLETLALPQLEKIGFEADDIIATLVAKNPETNFVIVTGDKDLLQMVGENVWCLDTMKQKWLNRQEAIEKFGVPPEKIVAVQALSGDSVDNIPGAPGVGPKTAADLINFYKDLPSVLQTAKMRHANPDLLKNLEKSDPLKGKKIESIAQNIEKVELSLKLVSLSHDAPVETHVDTFHQGKVEATQLQSFCERLGFEKLREKIKTLGITNSSSLASSGTTQNEADAPSGMQIVPPSEPLSVETKLTFQTTIFSNPTSFESFLNQHKYSSQMSLDTETKSLDSRSPSNLVGVSMAFDESHGVYIPLRHTHGDNFPLLEFKKILENFFQKTSLVKIIFQNAKFDLHVLSAEGITIPQRFIVEDTMIESFVLNPIENHGMDSLSVKYLEGYQPLSFEKVTEGFENFSEVPVSEAAYYSSEDAVVTMKLHEKLSTSLLEQSKTLFKVYEKIDRPLLRVLCEMESTGVHIDLAQLNHLESEWNSDLILLEKQALQSLSQSGVEVAEDFNLASPKQIAHVLFEKLQLPAVKKTKTGFSTDVGVLEDLSTLHPFPKLLLEIRELQKLLSTYVSALPELIDENDGRLHTDFSQTVASTGRLASSNPNLQNIPIRSDRGKRIRSAFSVPEGKALLGIDYSQIELRLLAHYSRDRNLLLAFHEEADIHRRTAALILGKDESKITSDERRMAKTINFGIIYGQTAFGLSKQLGISRGEAQQFIQSYMRSYPGISEFSFEAVEKAKSLGYSETLTGRRRPIPDIYSKNVPMRNFAERIAVNTPLQGTASDLIKVAMIRITQELMPNFKKSKMILQVHDELLFEADLEEVDLLKKQVVEIMEDPGLLKDFGVLSFEVKLSASAGIGRNWGELK